MLYIMLFGSVEASNDSLFNGFNCKTLKIDGFETPLLNINGFDQTHRTHAKGAGPWGVWAKQVYLLSFL